MNTPKDSTEGYYRVFHIIWEVIVHKFTAFYSCRTKCESLLPHSSLRHQCIFSFFILALGWPWILRHKRYISEDQLRSIAFSRRLLLDVKNFNNFQGFINFERAALHHCDVNVPYLYILHGNKTWKTEVDGTDNHLWSRKSEQCFVEA